MIKQQWENILNNHAVRQSLSQTRQEIKDAENRQLLQTMVKDKEDVLIRLLTSEDTKTRKNAALLMGDLGNQQFLEPLWNAYKAETQRFVKSSYLAGIGELDYRAYQEEIKVRLQELKKETPTPENEKHIREEIRELSALVVRIEGVQLRTFTGWNKPCEVLLLTNRNFTEQVKKELLEVVPTAKTKTVGVGLMALVENLNWVRKIRTYQELLFLIPEMKSCAMDEKAIAKTITESKLLDFLSTTHEGNAPYYFRLEMKARKSLGEKSSFLKKLAANIERHSNWKLVNSTDNYEFEIRLIENKQNGCNIMVKLFTLKDKRFTYREEVMPTSIRPVNAALTVSLAKEFLKEDAQVLDSFCGVGTMLIERHKAVRANTMYALDIQEEAIRKASRNTEIAKQIIHYINRDFFRFTHEYLFDEIITNMPFKTGRSTEEGIAKIYQQFFEKAPHHLKKGAIIILYSHDKEIVENLILESDFEMLRSHEISKREGTYVLILRYLT